MSDPAPKLRASVARSISNHDAALDRLHQRIDTAAALGRLDHDGEWCPRCEQLTLPRAGRCLWCDTPTTGRRPTG